METITVTLDPTQQANLQRVIDLAINTYQHHLLPSTYASPQTRALAKECILGAENLRDQVKVATEHARDEFVAGLYTEDLDEYLDEVSPSRLRLNGKTIMLAL